MSCARHTQKSFELILRRRVQSTGNDNDVVCSMRNFFWFSDITFIISFSQNLTSSSLLMNLQKYCVVSYTETWSKFKLIKSEKFTTVIQNFTTQFSLTSQPDKKIHSIRRENRATTNMRNTDSAREKLWQKKNGTSRRWKISTSLVAKHSKNCSPTLLCCCLMNIGDKKAFRSLEDIFWIM